VSGVSKRRDHTYLGVDVRSRGGANTVLAMAVVVLVAAVLVGVARGHGAPGKALLAIFNGLLALVLFVRPALRIRRLSGP
jgi:hypothetical protein